MKTVVDPEDPVTGAAKALGVALDLHKQQPVLLLLSGGSALAIPDRLPDSVFGPNLSIAMLDERWSEDQTINNFAQLMTTGFYERRAAAGATFFDSRPGSNESATTLAARYEVFLCTWRAAHPDGVVIAALGMGTDGHTAGIFPGYVAALDTSGKWVAAYEVPPLVSRHTVRISVTPRYLTHEITHAVAYVVGKDKHSVLASLTPDTDPELLPAALWYQIQSVTLVTDKALL